MCIRKALLLFFFNEKKYIFFLIKNNRSIINKTYQVNETMDSRVK